MRQALFMLDDPATEASWQSQAARFPELGACWVALDAGSVGQQLPYVGEHREVLQVRLSRELITLLSEQLYQSPNKAVEELVVNSFDADADSCHVVAPIVSAGTSIGELPLISVYDDGVGMDIEGLGDLWRVAASNKRTAQIEQLRKRRQIGKFGIGKLATYALANRITYLTSTGNGEVLALSLSFEQFRSAPSGQDEQPVELEVRSISLEDIQAMPLVARSATASGLRAQTAFDPSRHWTLVLLEELKTRARTLQPGRLRWVLRTAMPLRSDFRLFLNAEQITSSKEDLDVIASFSVSDLPESRLNIVNQRTDAGWHVGLTRAPDSSDETKQHQALVCNNFPEGVFGNVIVTDKSLVGKSADLGRSNGFFVRVRDRLINEENELFGLNPQAHIILSRFRADINAEDLDDALTAPREGVGVTERRQLFNELLLEILREARVRYDRWYQENRRKPEENKREDERNYVDPRNVEQPVADALLNPDDDTEGADADERWFYLEIPEPDELDSVIDKLYQPASRDPYEYSMEDLGRAGRLVRFIPGERRFILNSSHDLVIAFSDDRRARDLLYDLVTAEALLEVYLHEVDLAPHLVGDILERRDLLLRSLAREQVTSVKAIAANLRDAVSSERDLEIALIVAARALGFVAKHMSGATNPDGVARLRDYSKGERKITLEAKSSISVPSLGAIDFAKLARHVTEQGAQGCLLIAPRYPGSTRGADAAAAQTASSLRISCWTVEQLARVIEAMATRDITATQVLDIVLEAFPPDDVVKRVEQLLAEPAYPPRELAQAIMTALGTLEDIGPQDRVRSLDMVLPELGRNGVRASIAQLRNAVKVLAAVSQSGMTVMPNDRFRLDISVEELERRVSAVTGGDASARRQSTFRSAERRPGQS